ncbi:hypothetical protein [Thauera sp. Sel9]|nr:hypothetical protein [Thauera sp. Sel9]MCV2217821.1 hypothetical protein [Thauera sp. Sel9]
MKQPASSEFLDFPAAVLTLPFTADHHACARHAPQRTTNNSPAQGDKA